MGCFADRLSDHAFWANQFRLLLSVAAYWLLATVRCWLSRPHLPRLQLATVRLQVLKIGGWVRQRLGGPSRTICPDGRKLTIDIVSPGTFFGDMARVGQNMQDSCAEAAEDALVCVMSRTDIQ